MRVQISRSENGLACLAFDLETKIPTGLGASFSVFDPASKLYMTASGWSEDRTLLKPKISGKQSTILEVEHPLDTSPATDAIVEIKVPTANFAAEGKWPEAQARPQPSSPAMSKHPRPSLQKVLETLEVDSETAASPVALPPPKQPSNPSPPVQPRSAPPAVRQASTKHSPRVNLTLAASAILCLAGFSALGYTASLMRDLEAKQAELEQTRETVSQAENSVAAENAAFAAQRKFISEQTSILATERRQIETVKATMAANQREYNTNLERLNTERKAFDEARASQPNLPKVTEIPSPPPAASIPNSTITSLSPTPSNYANESENALIAACDQLAANPTNKDVGAGSGVTWGQLDTSAAITACEKANQAAPANRRVSYQLGRALHRAGNLDRARPIFAKLVEQQYPAAFDNAGALETDFSRSVWMFRKGAELGDPDSMDSLASLILKDQEQEKYVGETYQLLRKASDLGSTAARRRLDVLNAQAAQNAQALGAGIWALSTLRRFIR